MTVLHESPETRTTAPGIVEVFDEQAARTPDGVALATATTTISYRDLQAWSRALAARLGDRGAGPGGLVALAAQGVPAVAGVLAVLRSGAAYLGLDPSIPVRRQRRMVEETRPGLVLAAPGADHFPTLDVPRVRLGDAPPAGPGAGGPDGEPRPPHRPDPEDLFHVVYTSGTTGRPKGVRIAHRSVRNRLEWMWRDHPFGEGAVMAAHKPLSLVASPWEMLGGLLRGVPTRVLARDELLDPARFADVLDAPGAPTHLFLTPQTIANLLDEVERRGGLARYPALVTSGADTLPAPLARRFLRLLPGSRLLNLYGMTETASNVAAFDVAELDDDAETVPVGRPVAGASLTVHARLGRPRPDGAVGEVWVSGPPLALGYTDDQDADRFETLGGVLHYRTGDRGRLTSEGRLELVGRTDNQIKIRGYRVALEEIDRAVGELPGVVDAAAFLDESGPQGARLLAAVVTAPGEGADGLLTHVRGLLPDYMVPADLLAVSTLPRGGNGKVDRAALAALGTQTRDEDGVVEPVDDAERLVVDTWSDLLGAPPARRTQSFLDAGGHSLLAVRFVTRLRERTGAEVPLREFLREPTVDGIGALARHAPERA